MHMAIVTSISTSVEIRTAYLLTPYVWGAGNAERVIDAIWLEDDASCGQTRRDTVRPVTRKDLLDCCSTRLDLGRVSAPIAFHIPDCLGEARRIESADVRRPGPCETRVR